MKKTPEEVLAEVGEIAAEAWYGSHDTYPTDILAMLHHPYICMKDTDGDGDCASCAHDLMTACRQPVHTYQLGPNQRCDLCRQPIEHRIHPDIREEKAL